MSDEARDPRDEALVRRARGVFEASVEGLDARTVSRLAQARAAALDAGDSRRRTLRQWMVPLAAAASVALVAFLLMRAPGEPPPPLAGPGETTVVEPLELLGAGDDLELAAEDPEFYAWLEVAGLEEADGPG